MAMRSKIVSALGVIALAIAAVVAFAVPGVAHPMDGPTAVAIGPPDESQGPAAVTRLIFRQPRTLDELARELAGRTILQLRYTGDLGGVDQPGPAVDSGTAIENLRASTVRLHGVEPLVFFAIIGGALTEPQLSPLAGNLMEAQVFPADSDTVNLLAPGTTLRAAEATRLRESQLGRREAVLRAARRLAEPPPDTGVAPDIEHPWSPLSGTLRANDSIDIPDFPRTFLHRYRWESHSDLALFGDDFGYEHNLSTYNYNLPGPPEHRPSCPRGAYSNFWAGWADGYKWNSVRAGWNYPAESAPYWDWNDATDSCQKLDFTIGIGYPPRLEPTIEYFHWIAAPAGTEDSSEFDLSAQKLSNDCNDLGREPNSWCMGLEFNRPGSGSEPLIGASRAWRVPGCFEWTREQPPAQPSCTPPDPTPPDPPQPPPPPPPADRPPTANAGPDVNGQEGTPITLTGATYDPESTTPSTTWSYRATNDVDAGTECSFTDGNAAHTAITCTDDGIFEVTLTADDGVNEAVSDTAIVTVSNAAPTVTLTGPSTWQAFQAGTPVTAAVAFVDPGANDTHTCHINWDDGTTESFAATGGTCTSTSTFPIAGMYSLAITVTDDDGAAGNTSTLAIVFDPSAGFATAGGWLDSPPGGYPADPTAAGKARFTAQANYHGDIALTGNVQFGLHSALFELRSDTVEWMVITRDGKIAIKGTGHDQDGRPIGLVSYAHDGCTNTQNGTCGPGADQVRLVAWDLANGPTPESSPPIYDNQPGSSFDIDQTGLTPISAGAIHIHRTVSNAVA